MTTMANRTRKPLPLVLFAALLTVSAWLSAILPAQAETKHRNVAIGNGLLVDIHAPREANKLRFFRRKKVPVIVYVHGGGWIKGSKAKVYDLPGFANDRGWMVVSVSYRPWPRANIDQQVADVTRGIRWTQRNIRKYGGDPKRIVIMGHSAGSHLVSMVSAQKKVRGLRGVVANDVQAYDMNAYAAMRGSLPHMYAKAFGTTPKNWARWSPITYVKKGRRFPPHLIIYSGLNIYDRRRRLSRDFGNALKRRGTRVSYFDGRNYSHGAVMRRIGNDRALTGTLESFLKRAFR